MKTTTLDTLAARVRQLLPVTTGSQRCDWLLRSGWLRRVY